MKVRWAFKLYRKEVAKAGLALSRMLFTIRIAIAALAVVEETAWGAAAIAGLNELLRRSLARADLNLLREAIVAVGQWPAARDFFDKIAEYL